MAFKSHWEENKEALVTQALEVYEQTHCPSAGFNVLRYADMGLLHIKEWAQDYATTLFEENGKLSPGFVYLRLAKVGALQWNGF